MKIKIHPGLDHITDRADLLRDFVVFVCKDLQCMPCPIDIVNGRESAGLKTTAQYDTQNHHVTVNAKNRHFGDVLRSIAHELVHHKQNLNGELDAPVQDVGGDIEDEANARAGELLKSFAYQKGPERIYENLLREQEEEKKEKKIPGYFPTPEEKELAKMKTFGTPGFAEEFYKQAKRIGASPTHLATVINLETGGAWSPETRPYPFHTRKEIEAARKQGRKLKPKGKPVSSAHGLIQFMRKTRKEMKELLGKDFPGGPEDAVAQMQYVGDYFEMVKKQHPDANYGKLSDLYLAVFHRNALGKKPGYVIGSEKPNNYANDAAKANPAYIDNSMTPEEQIDYLEVLPGRELGNKARREKRLPEITPPFITKKSVIDKVNSWPLYKMADSLDPKGFGAGDLPTSVKIAEARKVNPLRRYIREMITAYGVGRVDPTKGGVGRMFKLGVDYKNAGTNIPHVGQGYVDRSHPLPYEITIRTNLDPKEMFNTLFGKDFSTDYVLIVPDQVSYTDDGFRLNASVSTGSNQGDEDDVNMISTALYKAVEGLPSTPDNANIVIDVHPVVDKIRYFV